ncbi:polyprenyl synthetase family protein [Nocardia sp. NPDC052566]|uniref:polyprenyl synthetase family protein n=1 Tax=Nocardia sp. NPDC052566 TaxID=3364330 RepID=UPI0037CB7883
MTTATAESIGDRDAGVVLRAARDRWLLPLRRAVETLPEPMRRMAGYHLGWWDEHGIATGGNGGKGLRPALVSATEKTCGAAESAAACAAVAIELIHNFTLIHDDVMDRDATRRGRATVWAVWGVTDAILLGDTLHGLAVRVLVDGLPAQYAAAAVARLCTAVIELGRGQQQDCAFERRYAATVAEYEAMAMGKTGSLMGCACALGALCAGADPCTIARMDRFGRELGLAFQFTDDILGIWGDPAVTGKPVGADLARRKLSLPVVISLASKSGAATELAALYRRDSPLTATEIARAAALIDATSGRRRAQELADLRMRSALRMIPDTPAADDLAALTRAVAHRNH